MTYKSVYAHGQPPNKSNPKPNYLKGNVLRARKATRVKVTI